MKYTIVLLIVIAMHAIDQENTQEELTKRMLEVQDQKNTSCTRQAHTPFRILWYFYSNLMLLPWLF